MCLDFGGKKDLETVGRTKTKVKKADGIAESDWCASSKGFMQL